MYHFVQPITYTHVHAHMHFTCNELKAFTNGACSSMQQYIYIHIYIYWGGGGGERTLYGSIPRRYTAGRG